MEDRIRELEGRVEHLEWRTRLLSEIADFEGHPFIYTVLESDLTESQFRAICDLMDEVYESIAKGKPVMNHYEFERRVYKIVPTHDMDYHFVQDIVSTANREGRWKEVYEHMKKSGMNI